MDPFEGTLNDTNSESRNLARKDFASSARRAKVCSSFNFIPLTYLWLVGNGGMGYNYNYYYYHSSISLLTKGRLMLEEVKGLWL